MGNLAELVVALRADASQYSKGMKQAEGDNKNFEKSTKGVGGVLSNGIGSMLGFAGSIAAGIGVANLAGGAINFLKDNISGTISAAAESQTVMAQTNAVLQSTHGASGQTAQSISDLAGQLQLLSGADDEAIQGAENMLATFTNIKGNVFPQTTKAVLDMATAMNGGAVPSAEQLRQTAIQVGKALNDPVKGVTALQRVGVKLSATQMEQVKHFMAVGDAASAQKIILGELSTEFGGAAAAAGGTFAGKMATLQGVLDNVRENIGGALLPVLTNLMGAVAPLVAQFANALPGALQTVGTLFAPIADAASNIWQVFQNGLRPAAESITKAFQNMQGPGAGLGDMVRQLSIGMGNIAPTFYQLGQTVGGVATQAIKNIQPILGNLGSIFRQLAPIVLDLASHALPLIGAILSTVGSIVGGVIMPLLSQLSGVIASVVMPIIKDLAGFFGVLFDVLAKDVLPVLQNIASAVMSQLVPPLQHIMSRILPPLNALFHFLGWVLGNVVGPVIKGVIGPVFGVLIGILGKVFDVIGWVIDRIGDFLGFLGRIKDTMGTAFGTIGQAIDKARAVVRAGIEAILELLSHIPGPAGDMARGVLNGMKAADDATRAHTEAMKASADMNTAAMAMAALKHTDEMRRHILTELEHTKDPAKRHMLEMKLGVLSHTEEMQKKAVEHAQQLAQQHGEKMEQMKAKARDEAKAAKENVLDHIGQMKDQALSKVGDFIGGVASFFQSLPGKIGTALGTAKDKVFDKINEIKDTFKRGLDKILGFFTGLHLEFPKIKMPHFSVNGSFSLNPPSVPKLDIQWYGTGGIFTSPQIVGLGDRPEAVIPLDRLPSMMGGNGGGSGGGNTTIILEIDGRQFATATLPYMVGEIRRKTGLKIN